MKKHHRKASYINPVSNSVYKENCGACHFTYQPELLPGKSWERILINLDNHFGESVELDENSKKIISDYLKLNNAEKSYSKRSSKIMRSIRNNEVIRITDTPYIKSKHRKINFEIFKRKSIGSFSNCTACHTTSEEGIYDDDNVRIPE